MKIKTLVASSGAVALLSAAAVVGIAGPASAHTPVINVDCDSISLDLFNYPDGANTFTATLDGADMGTNVVFGSEYHSGNIALDPNVPHSWTVVIDAVDGTYWDTTLEGSSDEDCLPDVPEVPEQPADIVTYGEWVDGSADCEATEVVQNRTKSVTTSTLIDNVWVPSEPVVTTEQQTRALTPEEIKHNQSENAEGECYVAPEPPTYQPTCTAVNDSYEITGDGVIAVEGDWDSNSINVPLNGISTLSDIGTVLDIDATPLQYVGLHIHTTEGTIVFEEEGSYNGQLWSNNSWAGVNAGLGYAALGSIEEYIHLNGDVTVTGIDLLYTHPEASSTTVESFTIGCTVYTFVAEVIPPVEEPPVVVPPVVEPPVVVTPPVAAVVTPIETASLASTGVNNLQGISLLAGGLVGFGLLIVVIALVRRRMDKKVAE